MRLRATSALLSIGALMVPLPSMALMVPVVVSKEFTTQFTSAWQIGEAVDISVMFDQISLDRTSVGYVSYDFSDDISLDLTTQAGRIPVSLAGKFVWDMPDGQHATSLVDTRFSTRYTAQPSADDPVYEKTIALHNGGYSLSPGSGFSTDTFGTGSYAIHGTLTFLGPSASVGPILSDVDVAGTLTRTATVNESVLAPVSGGVRQTLNTMLRSLFVWTSHFLPQQKPAGCSQGCGGGLRGDAGDILRQDLLAHPVPQLGTVGIWLQTGSPSVMAHAVTMPATSVNLSFDYTLLDPGTTLSVKLGGFTLFNANSQDQTLGELQHVSLGVGAADALTELSFELDGPAAHSAVVTALSFGDLSFASDGWFSRAHGPAQRILTLDDDQLAHVNDLVDAVPEPPAGIVFAAGVFVVAATRPRHEARGGRT